MLSSTSSAALLALLLAIVSVDGYVLHVSDIHMDLSYSVGAPTQCSGTAGGLNTCCHVNDKGTGSAGQFGDTGVCDAPQTLVDGVLAELAKEYGGQEPEYIVFTGDIASHNIWQEDNTRLAQDWAVFFEMIQAHFGTNKVLTTIGNHDSFPDHQLYPDGKQKLMADTAAAWQKFIPFDKEALTTLGTWGYYTMALEPGLRLVSVNSFYYDKLNLLMSSFKNQDDPAGMKAWLLKTLSAAQAAGEEVIIMGHIPPEASLGNLCNWTDWYHDKVIGTFSSIIKYQFYGHTHRDQLVFTRPSLASPSVGVAFVSPAISPMGGLWPSLRVFSDNDAIVYGVNVTRANADGFVTLEKVYSFSEAYGLPYLSLASWDKFLAGVLSDESIAVNYLRAQNQAGLVSPNNCDASCRKNLFCSLAYSTASLQQQCLQQQWLAAGRN